MDERIIKALECVFVNYKGEVEEVLKEGKAELEVDDGGMLEDDEEWQAIKTKLILSLKALNEANKIMDEGIEALKELYGPTSS